MDRERLGQLSLEAMLTAEQHEDGMRLNEHMEADLRREYDQGRYWAGLVAIFAVGRGAPAWAWRAIREGVGMFTSMEVRGLNEAFDVDPVKDKLGPQQRSLYVNEKLAVFVMSVLYGDPNPYPGNAAFDNHTPAIEKKAERIQADFPTLRHRTRYPDLALKILEDYGLHLGLTSETIRKQYQDTRQTLGKRKR